MLRFVIGYIATLLTFCVLDFIWRGWVAKGFYQSQIGALLLAQPNWVAAVLFYAIFAIGIQIFCVAPALEADAFSKVVISGAVFGFFCYMTYDLRNLATLKGWATSLSMVDILWGTFITSVAASAGYVAAHAFARSA
ncbi:MAG: DUF2177 family protein [Betaproteobacteria bacterium]